MSDNIKQYEQNPLFRAIITLNDKMEENNSPDITLNVVGGFALMAHGLRNKSDKTDIDYVGSSVPFTIKDMATMVASENADIPLDWLNNDLMLTGTTLEDLEYSTGELHFKPAYELSKININVLEMDDLLRLKCIAIDTALTSIELGGDFSRFKDFNDIIALMDKMGYEPDDLSRRYKDYLINEKTVNIISLYEEKGREETEKAIKRMQAEYIQKQLLEMDNPYPDKSKETFKSPLIDRMLEEAFKRANNENKVIDSTIAADGYSSASLVDLDGDGTPDVVIIHNNDNERIADVRDCDPEKDKIRQMSHDDR